MKASLLGTPKEGLRKRKFREYISDTSSVARSSMKSFLNKTFVIERGSIRGSVLQLCALCQGPGVFNLPYMFTRSGFLLGIILLASNAIMSAWGMKNILECAENKQTPTYASLVRKIAGPKFDRIITILFFFAVVGAAVAE